MARKPTYEELEQRIRKLEKTVIDLKQGETDEKHHWLKFLSETAMELIEFPFEENLLYFAADKIKELVGDLIVGVSTFNEETKTICLQRVVGLGKFANAVIKIFGRDPVGMLFRIDDAAVRNLMTSKLVEVPGGILGLSPGDPKDAWSAIASLLGLGKAYSIGFSWKGKLFGNATLVLPKGHTLRNQYRIETLVRQTSVALLRRQAEEQVRETHDKLEELVRERTGELEETNEKLKLEIEERKQAEEWLRAGKERYRFLAENMEDIAWTLDRNFRTTYVSPSIEKMLGFTAEERKQQSIEETVTPETLQEIQKRFIEELQRDKEDGVALDRSIIIEVEYYRKDGSTVWMENRVQPIRDSENAIVEMLGVSRDITERKQAEEALLRARKLESLGVLAGGIAHDFNNLMSAVVGNISLARMEIKPGSKAFDNLVKAEKASIQTKELTARLITFSKGGGPVKETVSIGDLVKDAVGSSLKSSDISCKFSISDDILPTEADEKQMKQVIHNVVTNAQEAMAGQGSINVSCENADIGEKDTLTLKDGKYVKISLRDQGPGIPKKDLPKIFDPYFSTKEMGTQKGMGLGLAVSDSIVKRHDGLITVESELGRGTTLSIYLPASEKEIEEAAPVKKPVPEKPVTRGEKILVMDDEEMVRDVSNALLTHLGYEAEVAADGVEAIEMYRKAMESEKPFDMVILDLTNKAGMGGMETIKRLLQIDPHVKAIIASGYSNDPVMGNFKQYGFCGALPKPFTMKQLDEVLDKVKG